MKPILRNAFAVTLTFQILQLVSPAIAAPAAPAIDQRVRESERKQQIIRTQTQRIGEELTSIITEFENNGMGEGEDVKVLRAIKNVLGKLSDKEMARVIELLGAARGVDDPAKTKSKVAEAFGGQKTIVVELRQLLLEYERQQELYELSLRFAQLAARQNGNLKEAKRLVRTSEGRALDRFDENQKISLSVQKDEQTAIRDEALGLLRKLETLTKDADSSVTERLNQSLQAAKRGKTEELLRTSVDELKSGALYRATKSEMDARDQLRELSRLVAPPKDAQEILRQAAAELERLVGEQKQTILKTLGLTPDVLRANKEATFDVEDVQGDLVERTDAVKKDIEHLVPLASEKLAGGEDQMQEARSAILERRKDEAAKREQQAVFALEAAHKLVLDELNKQDKKQEQPADKLAAAKELKEKVEELKKEQEKLKADTQERKEPRKASELAPAEAKLQNEARDLQPQAAQSSVPAADAIADAAREMGKAQAALDKKEKLEQSTAPQQAAIDNLARAEKLLDKEIAQLEQAKSDLDQLEKTREKVAELIKNENKIEIATAKADAMQNPAKAADAKDPQKPADSPKAADQKAADQKAADAKAADQKPGDQKAADQKNADQKSADAKAADQKPADQKAADQKAAADQNKSDQNPKAADAKSAEQMKNLAKDQADNAAATADTAANLPDAAKDAAAPLNDAKGDMQEAQKNLNKPDAAAAKPQEKQAVANLEKAKDAIDKKIADLQNQLGQPADAQAAAANADLAQAIAKAQSDIGQAMQQGEQGQQAQTEKGQQAQGDKGQQAQGEKGQQAQGEKGQQAQGEKGQGEKGQQAQGNKPQNANAKQAQSLQNTAKELSDAAAQASAPAAVDAAIAQATDALAQAAGAAEAGNQPSAQADAAAAQDALAQAAAALAMAQQGASSSAQANAQGQGEKGQGEKGQGQGQGQEQGQGQDQGQGQGQAKGNQPGKGQGKDPSQSPAEAQGQSSGDRQSGHAAAADNGQRGSNKGQGEFIKLPKRDRNAIMQSRKESAPGEYAPAIEQYLKNLSDTEDK